MTEKKTLAELSGWMMPKAKRSNAEWCSNEEYTLLQAVFDGLPLASIAILFERTEVSIVLRLQRIKSYQEKALELTRAFLATDDVKSLGIKSAEASPGYLAYIATSQPPKTGKS